MSVFAPRQAAFAAAGVAVAALGIGVWYAFLAPRGADAFAECRETTVAASSDVFGGPFELTDHTGARVTDADVFSGPTLLYFGYTWCPDVCPFDVARMAEATEVLEERGVEVTPVFVTVDPERDDPESLSDFVWAHHPRMVGLTGTAEEIRVAASAWRVYYARRGEEAEDYLVDHSTFTYLVDAEHGFLDVFRSDLDGGGSPEEMASRVQCYLERT
ncbi:MAG: SCO family protein [Pseudomonadota bacterium]